MQNRIGYPGIAGHGGVVSRFLIRVLCAIGLIGELDKCSPVAPLGLWLFGYAAFYKHAAPLGLNAEPNSLPRQCWSRWGGVSFFNPCPLRNRSHR